MKAGESAAPRKKEPFCSHALAYRPPPPPPNHTLPFDAAILPKILPPARNRLFHFICDDFVVDVSGCMKYVLHGYFCDSSFGP